MLMILDERVCFRDVLIYSCRASECVIISKLAEFVRLYNLISCHVILYPVKIIPKLYNLK
jgi:hypothetical protein